MSGKGKPVINQQPSTENNLFLAVMHVYIRSITNYYIISRKILIRSETALRRCFTIFTKNDNSTKYYIIFISAIVVFFK